MIKTFRTIIHLKIVNNNKFNAYILFVAKNDKNIAHKLKIVVDSNANATIEIMLYDVEKRFEWFQHFENWLDVKNAHMRNLNFIIQLTYRSSNLVVIWKKWFHEIIMNKIVNLTLRLNVWFVWLCFVNNFITKNAKIKRKKFKKINVSFLNHDNDVNFIDMIKSFVSHLQRVEIYR